MTFCNLAKMSHLRMSYISDFAIVSSGCQTATLLASSMNGGGKRRKQDHSSCKKQRWEYTSVSPSGVAGALLGEGNSCAALATHLCFVPVEQNIDWSSSSSPGASSLKGSLAGSSQVLGRPERKVCLLEELVFQSLYFVDSCWTLLGRLLPCKQHCSIKHTQKNLLIERLPILNEDYFLSDAEKLSGTVVHIVLVAVAGYWNWCNAVE